MIDQNSILIIGAHGQLGKALQAKYPNAQAVDSDVLDITDQNAVNNFDWSPIKYILNAAAYTNVDGAESSEGRRISWAVNATAVAILANVVRAHNLTLVHISSDYVFDGTEDNHTEDEPLSPLSVYGASKAAGDIAAASADKYYILRTSWVIGEGKNFVGTMLGLAEKNISPTVVHDQVGRLTFTSELVKAIDHLLSNNVTHGIYNVSNEGKPSSWADITRKIFELVDRDDLTVTNTSTQEYYEGKEGIAPRPLQSTLALNKVKATGFQPTDWELELERYIKETNS